MADTIPIFAMATGTFILTGTIFGMGAEPLLFGFVGALFAQKSLKKQNYLAILGNMFAMTLIAGIYCNLASAIIKGFLPLDSVPLQIMNNAMALMIGAWGGKIAPLIFERIKSFILGQKDTLLGSKTEEEKK
jgi:hypothetical protein